MRPGRGRHATVHLDTVVQVLMSGRRRIMRRFIIAVFSTLILLVAMTPAAQAISFTFQTIDPPGPFFTIAPFGCKDSRKVSGSFTDAALREHGFLFDGTIFTVFDHPSADATKVFALRGTDAFGLNNAGQIAGSYTQGGVLHGSVRGSTGTFTTLDVPGHLHTALTGINDLGAIAGEYSDTGSITTLHSFLRDSGGTFTLFDVPGATTTQVGGLNNASQSVGVYNTQGGTNPFRGFLRASGGVFTLLDVPAASETVPFGINDGGTIVGDFTDAAGTTHAFLRDSGGTITPFDVPGATVTAATEINNRGEIVGQFCDASDICHGFLAIPVPESGSLALLAAGHWLLVVKGFRHREP